MKPCKIYSDWSVLLSRPFRRQCILVFICFLLDPEERLPSGESLFADWPQGPLVPTYLVNKTTFVFYTSPALTNLKQNGRGFSGSWMLPAAKTVLGSASIKLGASFWLITGAEEVSNCSLFWGQDIQAKVSCRKEPVLSPSGSVTASDLQLGFHGNFSRDTAAHDVKQPSLAPPPRCPGPGSSIRSHDCRLGSEIASASTHRQHFIKRQHAATVLLAGQKM